MKKVRRKRRRIFRIIILVMFLLLALSLGFVLLFAYVFDIKTKAVIIHGNKLISDNEILEIANLKDYPNYFLTNTNDYEKSLKKNSLIESAKIKRKMHFQFHIYVNEKKPLFIREDTNKIVFGLNDEIDNNIDKMLDVPYLINYVPNTKYEKLIDKLQKTDYSLLKKISQIKYEPTKYDEDRFILYMNDSNRVYINLPKFKSFDKYDEMVTKFEGKTGKLYLDSGNYFEIDK